MNSSGSPRPPARWPGSGRGGRVTGAMTWRSSGRDAAFLFQCVAVHGNQEFGEAGRGKVQPGTGGGRPSPSHLLMAALFRPKGRIAEWRKIYEVLQDMHFGEVLRYDALDEILGRSFLEEGAKR